MKTKWKNYVSQKRKWLVYNRHSKNASSRPPLLSLCAQIEVVYLNDIFSNCRYMCFCFVPSGTITSSINDRALLFPVSLLSCFCLWSLLEPFTLPNLFCLEFFIFSLHFLSFLYHFVAYFGTSGPFMPCSSVWEPVTAFDASCFFAHQNTEAERFLLNIFLHGPCRPCYVC